MTNHTPITQEIQRLRSQLETLLANGRDIADSEVIAISHEMDRLVLAYYDEGKAAAQGR